MTATDATTGNSRKKVLALGVVLLVLAGAGAGFLLRGGAAEAVEPAASAPAEDGAVVPVADMTATLAGPHLRYAKIAFSAVLAPEADEGVVTARFDLLRDAAITELSTISAEHLRTTAGMDELRARLSARAGELYPGGEVLRIVLTELVVQ